MLKFSKKMKEIYSTIQFNHGKNLYKSIEKLCPEFIEVGGCVLIDKGKDVHNIDIDKILQIYYDRTGYEASYNEMRIEDYFDEFVTDKTARLALAIKLSEIWECKLKIKYPDYKFHIVINYDGNFTTIRFYKLREEESSWIAINDLDEYEDDGVLVRIVQ